MNIKKLTKKGADGSSIIYEFDVPKMDSIPNHPGEPKGPDTVPAWLTPGEFVVNAEATRMFEPQIEAMNDAGRAVQRQQGGTIPEYKADGGGVDNSVERYGIPSDYKGNVGDAIYNAMSNPSEQSYTYKPGQTEDRNQNIYNFAYEGRLDLDTVSNATPFDKSIIMQAMNDAQGNSEVPMNTSVPEPTTPGYVPQYGVNRDPKYAETIKQYAPTGDEFSLGDVYDYFTTPKGTEQMDTPTVTTEDFINDSQSPGDVPMELSGINPSDLLSQQRANLKNQDIVIDEFGVGVLPGEGSRSSTAFTPPKNLAELTGGVLGFSEDVERVRKSKQNEAIANSITSVINNPDLTSETKDLDPKDAEQAGVDIVNLPTDPESNDEGKGGFLSKVANFFTENFKDLIDDDKLMNAALMYAGSRALGYSHGGSLNFVGRNYFNDIQKKLNVADKAALSNKYTEESVKKYRDTGKVEDLELAKNIQLVNSEILVDDMGNQVRVNKYEDKNSGKTVYQTDDGKPVQRAKYSTQPEDNAGNDRVVKAAKPIYESEIAKYAEINPELALKLPSGDALGTAAYRLGKRYKLSPSLIGSKIESITKNMIKHVNATGETLSADSIEPFLTQEFLTASLDDMEIKNMVRGANTKALNKLNGTLSPNRDPIELADKYQKYAKEYKAIKDKKFFKSRANPEEGITELMVYIQEQLNKPTS